MKVHHFGTVLTVYQHRTLQLVVTEVQAPPVVAFNMSGGRPRAVICVVGLFGKA